MAYKSAKISLCNCHNHSRNMIFSYIYVISILILIYVFITVACHLKMPGVIQYRNLRTMWFSLLSSVFLVFFCLFCFCFLHWYNCYNCFIVIVLLYLFSLWICLPFLFSCTILISIALISKCQVIIWKLSFWKTLADDENI